MKKAEFFVLAGLLFSIGCGSPTLDSNSGDSSAMADSLSLKLQKIADGLHSPVAAAFTPDGVMLVCDQIGVIRSLENNKLNDAPFLDIQDKLIKLSGAYDERGLLGIALHPDYSNNKKFYVYYSAPPRESGSDNQGIISEFTASSDGLKADPATERILLTVEEPESNHNGGDLKFGPDGYLYIGLGDGGGAGDKHGESGNGQNLNNLLGKILRIDINDPKTYKVPSDNPFVGKSAKPEIWAYGLRNPWRFSFDKNTGQLFVGDVGQNKFEEVNIVEKGGNYGWKVMEATHCFDPEQNCKTEGLKQPIAEYPHAAGISITGGFVYNGSSIENLKGKYVFADYSGPMFFLAKTGDSWKMGNIQIIDKLSDDLKILSFAEDNDSELYVLTNEASGPKGNKGAIYKLVKP